MTYKGTVEKGGVILLESGTQLPEGASVRIELVEKESRPTQEDSLDDLSDLAVDTGITDLARNVDHYLYGHPQVDD